MMIDGLSIPDLIRLTFREPRQGARRVLNVSLDSAILWQAMVLVVVLSVLIAHGTALLSGAHASLASDPMIPGFLLNPMTLGFIQCCLLVIMIFAVHWVGHSFGGTGTFEGAIALVTWLQFLLVCIQIVQSVLGLVIPSLTNLIGLAGMVVFFWLLTQFICELHGFRAAGNVFIMILVTMLALIFALSVLLAVMSMIVGVEMSNV